MLSDEQWRIVAYLDSVQARLASLRELQSQTQEELDALLPSVLRPLGGRSRKGWKKESDMQKGIHVCKL